MADRKRNRSTNWFKNEASLLKSLVPDYESTLSSRHSNEDTIRKKKEIWECITNQISLLAVCNRTVSEVKTKWINIARFLKQEFIEYSKESTKTGEGPTPCSSSPEEQRLTSVFTKTRVSVEYLEVLTWNPPWLVVYFCS